MILNEDIRQSVVADLEVILQKREGDLAAAIGRLDAVKGSVSGHLSHYLTKRSYLKAWEYLGGLDPEKGTCHPQ